MIPEDLQSLISEYLAGQLGPQEQDLLEARMQADLALSAEVDALRELWSDLSLLPSPRPSLALRAGFYQKLNSESRRKSTIRFSWWKQCAAAAVIFLLGVGAGNWVRPNTPPTEISQLRSQVEGLQQTVALSLMQKPSASSRLEGVEWTSQVAKPDLELITALQTTLNQDQNINVRLAALDALEKFTSDSGVRKVLEQSITKQQSPLVQIALIDALVHIHDRSAAEQFKELSGDRAVNAVVRQRAQWAVEKLSLN